MDEEPDPGSPSDPGVEVALEYEPKLNPDEHSVSGRQLCGAMTQSGGGCKQKAGWGIPGSSSGPCKFHASEGEIWQTFDELGETTSQETVRKRATFTEKAVLLLTAVAVMIGFATYYRSRPTRKTDVRFWNSIAYDPESDPDRWTFDGGEFKVYCQSPSLLSSRPDFASCMLWTGRLGLVMDPCLRIRKPANELKGHFVCGHPDNSDKTANIYESVDLEPASIPTDLGLPVGVPWMIKFGDRYCTLEPVADEEPWRNSYACPAGRAFIPQDPEIWTTPGGIVNAMEAGSVPRLTFNGIPRSLEPGGEPTREIADVAGVVVDVSEVSPGVFEGRFSLDGVEFEYVFIEEVWY